MGTRFCVVRYVEARGAVQSGNPDVSPRGGKGEVSENNSAVAARAMTHRTPEEILADIIRETRLAAYEDAARIAEEQFFALEVAAAIRARAQE